jgi:hypothetical protein
MKSIANYFVIPEIPDYTHYKYVTAYEGSVRDHIFLRAEHLLRMVANFNPGGITLVLRYIFDPRSSARPQDRMRLSLGIKTEEDTSPGLVDQIIRYGPMAEFYLFEKDVHPFQDWEVFHATSEIIRLEEGIKPSSPPDLDIRKINPRIPKIYYCIHPFKPRSDNDFLMLDRACSSLDEPALLEILVQPVSQIDELDMQYREIIRLMAVNSYGRHDYIVHADQFDPLGDLYEPKPPGHREIKAKDPIADEFSRAHREFHRILRQPQLQFNVKTWASKRETAHILASTAAESAFEEGTYKLLDYERGTEWFERSLKASRNLVPFTESCDRDVWEFFDAKGLFRLAHMASVDEFKGMFRFPIAGYSTPCCLWKSTDYHRKMETEDGLLVGYAFSTTPGSKSRDVTQGLPGQHLDVPGPVDLPVTMPINLLTKHMFVAGVPGSGKTTAIFNLLVQLFKCGVPFLVIEPGKAEYRQLKTLQDHYDHQVRELASELRIYTPGKDEISPFRFNPFEYPEGTTIDEHIGQVLTCFESSMPLWGPLQALLAESVEAVYREKQKHTMRGNQQAIFPTMADLVNSAKEIMKGKGYAGEVRANISAAIDVRLSSLTRLSIGKIFQCRESLPSINELLKHPTIIEIQNLNPYQACLLMFFLLSAIWEEIRNNRRQSKDLKHVTVIEEAHNIVGRTDQARPSEDFADPKAYAAEYVVRMLAEIRALGEGIIIADQLPSAVASSVVKNTGTKLAHRLVSLIDREDIGGAMLLQGPQTEEIARLEPGQAYYYTEGLYAPRQVAGINAREFLDLGKMEPPANHELAFAVKEEDWFVGHKRARYACLVHLLSEHYERFNHTVEKTAGHLEIYREMFDRLREKADIEAIGEQLKSLRADVIGSREALKASFISYLDFSKSIPEEIANYLQGETLRKYATLDIRSNGPIIKQASRVESELENLRSQITNML